MRAILINRSGFKKEVNLNEEKPVIEMMSTPRLDFELAHAESTVTVYRMTFYYEREFFNEDEDRILVYKEK
jgi:hypothetical protein